MKTLRKICNIRWYEHKTNLQVLKLTDSKHLTTMIENRLLRYAGHLWRYPKNRFARQSMFDIDWHVTRVGKRYPIGGVWSTKVSEHLRAHGFNLAMDKETYSEKNLQSYI